MDGEVELLARAHFTFGSTPDPHHRGRQPALVCDGIKFEVTNVGDPVNLVDA
jgi:hypothetical protein